MTTTRKVRSINATRLKSGAHWVSMTAGRTRYHLIVGNEWKLVGFFSETPRRGFRIIDAETVNLNSALIPRLEDGPAARKTFLQGPLFATLEWTT